MIGLLIHIRVFCDKHKTIDDPHYSLHHLIFNDFTDYYTFVVAIFYSLTGVITLYVVFRGYITEISCFDSEKKKKKVKT